MSKLGSPSTNKFSIGTAEVRLGPLSVANKMTQAHSVGLLDDATVEVSQNSVDLLGGFPQVIVDTAITSQETNLTATAREYSKRNIAVMLGEGASATYDANVSSLVVSDVAAAGVTFDVSVGTGADFTVGTIVTIYPEGFPEQLSICRIASIAVDAITLDAETPVLFDYNGTTATINIFEAQPAAIGNITETNYFAVMLVQTDREFGRPVVFNFWKGAVGAGMTLGTNATDFASTEINIKLLQPAVSEYATGAPLEHLANIIPDYPVGMYAAGGDV